MSTSEQRAETTVSSSPVTKSRPPTQVFTRGTTGAVKTRSLHRRSRSHTRPRSPQKAGRSRSSQPPRSRPPAGGAESTITTSSATTFTSAAHSNTSYGFYSAHSGPTSVTSSPTTYQRLQGSPSVNNLESSTTSDQGSVHSLPSNASSLPQRRTEGRESYQPRRPREISPAPSLDSDKLHTKTSRRVMDELSRAVGSERRIASLTHVCECFDHNDEIKHNVELSQGALQVLVKVLLAATYDDEVRMTLAAMEMVLRGSPRAVHLAYGKVGGQSLLISLLRLLDRCETGSMKHAEISILNITKILLYLSRCPDLRASLCRQQGVLDSLKRVASTPNGECRLTRIRVLANLTSCEENKVLMYEQEGIVEAIVKVAHLDSIDVARQYAGSALMDLASATPNQVLMANDDKVLGTLVKMTLVEKSTATRESVITALQNLAFAKENRFRLVAFKDGILLEALKQALSSDLDAKARRRAAGALTNLVCADTAERMGRQKGLLDTLAIVTTKDPNLDVQTRASLALTKIANLITVRMECHEALLDALVVASLSKASNSVSAVLRVKARDPENRETMARHPGVIDTLADICVSDSSSVNDRDNAMRAIMHLVNEGKNRKILCNRTVLDSLVAGATYKDPDLDEARDSAIRAMERLATEYSNREFMARHPGLLTAVAQAVEREAAWEEAGRESEHGYLAKPLLMSLLVAM